MEQPRERLSPGHVVERYEIMRCFSSGGFGLIYLARDLDLGEEVVLKELLPKKLAKREPSGRVTAVSAEKIDVLNQSKKLFFQEITALASLKHPNIVHVRNCVVANGTGYLVMDYEPGQNLGSYIKKHQGGLSLTFLMTVFPPLLDALHLIHSRNLLHLDIKPNNIHLRPGGKPLLLDFGAVHRFATTRSTLSGRVVTTGFSPVEQYQSAGYVGPWSDVYAVGASMRACLEGKPPPSAIERHAKDTMPPASRLFKRQYPAFLLKAVDWAMEVDPLLRPQNAGELLIALEEKSGRPSGLLADRRPPHDRATGSDDP